MNKTLAPLALFLLSSLLGGCLYANVSSPYSYRSASPVDVQHASSADAVLNGQACNKSLLWLFAWGRGGYIDAVRDALKDHPQSILYDVKTDIKIESYVLGLWSKQCTLVTGKLGQL